MVTNLHVVVPSPCLLLVWLEGWGLECMASSVSSGGWLSCVLTNCFPKFKFCWPELNVSIRCIPGLQWRRRKSRHGKSLDLFHGRNCYVFGRLHFTLYTPWKCEYKWTKLFPRWKVIQTIEVCWQKCWPIAERHQKQNTRCTTLERSLQSATFLHLCLLVDGRDQGTVSVELFSTSRTHAALSLDVAELTVFMIDALFGSEPTAEVSKNCS